MILFSVFLLSMQEGYWFVIYHFELFISSGSFLLAFGVSCTESQHLHIEMFELIFLFVTILSPTLIAVAMALSTVPVPNKN